MKNRKVGFIGAGNMAQTMIKALIDSGTLTADQIYVTNRASNKSQKLQETYGINHLTTNEALIEKCDTVVIAVKPQDLTEALEPIAQSFHDGHLVMSLAAGYSLASLKKLLPEVKSLARIMPNTPSSIQRGVIGYCMAANSEALFGVVEDFLKPMGFVVKLPEGEQFEALTVSAASGTGFILELMEYWQEWIMEHGIEPVTARKMVVETFMGAAMIAEKQEIPFNELQERVVSKKGVTAAGLQSMRELEVERALRYSFEKAALRDQEITRTSAKS